MKFAINNVLAIILGTISLLGSIVNVNAESIELEWDIRAYPDATAQVGDTITFTWDSGHNVYIHPTGSCDETGAIEVGVESPAVYTFTEANVGQSLFFACNVGSHCEFEQHVTVVVSAAGDVSTPSAAPVAEGGGPSDMEPAPTGSAGAAQKGIVLLTLASALLVAALN